MPPVAQAHLGGGPPFLKINGKDAQTNSLNQGASVMTIPWDNPPETYHINQPITFEIDVSELMKATTVPPEYANDIKIRWSVATGDNFEIKGESYDEGSRITKTIADGGSYLIIIEAKLPADSDFILINTVQINVLPSTEYELPFASVFIGTQFDDVKKNVLLVSDASTDPSANVKKQLWDFGDGILQEGESITRKFEDVETMGTEQVFHRVVDEQGFIADVGFMAENQNGKLQFLPFDNEKNLSVTVGTYQDAAVRAGRAQNKLSVPAFLGVGSGIIVLIGIGWWLFLKKGLKFKR